MFTPQQLAEVGFTKAVFGGYDMDSVHDVLDPLTEDYTTLYKENAVLKSKLRILVEKLEEYRSQGVNPDPGQAKAAEETARDTIRRAEDSAAQIIREARARADRIVGDAEDSATRSARVSAGELQVEEERLASAKQATADFIRAMEAELRRHQELLDNLKLLDLPEASAVPEEPAAPAAPEAPAEPVVPAAPAAPAAPPVPEEPEASDEIAKEIEQNLEKQLGTVPNSTFDASTHSAHDTKIMRPLHPESITAKFGDLQFGKNYNPKH